MLSHEWRERLITTGVALVVIVGIGGVVWIDNANEPDVYDDGMFDCGDREWMIVLQEGINDQKLMASLIHRGVSLELRENTGQGGFSLLWTEAKETEPTSCVIASGWDWTLPPAWTRQDR